MIEIGQALKEKRVALGLTLDQLEHQTKIRRKYLEAIEDGNWSVLPGDVYARGFVRSYAEAVGLDGQELLSRLGPKESGSSVPPVTPVPSEKSASKRTPTAKPSKPAARQRTVTPPARRPGAAKASKSMNSRGARRRSGIGVNGGQVAVVVGVLILLGVGWWALGRPHGTNPASNTTNHAGTQNLVSDNQTGNSTGNSAGSNAVGNNSTTTPPPTPQVTVAASPQSNGDVTYTVTAPATQPLSATLTTTSAPCWVSVTKDGHLLSAGGQTLAANSSGSWTAKGQMLIRVGNLTGVSLKLNGQAVALPNVNHPINVTINKKSQ